MTSSSIIKVKLTIFKNILLRTSKTKLLFFFILAMFLLGGLFALLYYGLKYFEVSSPFGPYLSERLFSFFFMTLLVMLIFSNLINSYTTLYSSKENEYLLTLPLDHHWIFSVKFIESTLLSSWALMLLAIPLVITMGFLKNLPLSFYLRSASLLSIFIFIPASLGILLAITLASLFPKKRERALLFGILILLLPFCLFFIRYYRVDPRADSHIFLYRILDGLAFASSPLLPNHWLVKGMSEDYLYYLLLLGSNALMGFYLSLLIAKRLYYPSWSKWHSAETGEKGYLGASWIESLFQGMNPAIKAIIVKDIKTFFREPTLWGQLLLFLGLLLIYLPSLKDIGGPLYTLFYRHFIITLNIGGVGLILSTLNTRFVFPIFSLEGMRFWMIRLSRLEAPTLILIKFVSSSILCLVTTLTFFILTNITLRTPPFMSLISYSIILLMSLAMSGLSLGLGVLFSNLKVDNPTVVVSGLGGTINGVLCLIYVILVEVLVGLPVFLHLAGYLKTSLYHILLGFSFMGILLLSLGFCLIPLRLGIRALKEMEF
ncbi:TPA: hypothetical protein DCX15_01545 [bacterium]|nr:hypothetical protein [bacterium]